MKKLFSKVSNFFKVNSSKEKPNGMVALQKELIQKKLKQDKIRYSYFEQEAYNRSKDRTSGYVLDRNYANYNTIFNRLFSSHKILKRDIVHTLRVMAYRHKKKKISVLDDGAGKGYFLAQLKEKWNALKKEGKVKASLETTAVTLSSKTIALKNIDEIKKGNVANFLPTKKYDLIISVYGGFEYTIPEIQKEVLLKYCYSLNKGGVGVFGIEFTLLPKITSIQNAFEKRGFKFDLMSMKKNIFEKLPSNYLVIERVK